MTKIISLEKKKTRLSFRSPMALTLLIGGLLALVIAQAPSAHAQTWSAPVNLGSAINSTASDQQPAISPDGLSLYFASTRLPTVGGFDMYVSQRASVAAPWGAPVNIGPLNTTSDEGNPAFSRDGRFLFFQSKRLPSLGGIDIFVAQRNNPHDDFGWQPAVNLGTAVNSTADDTGPCYFEDNARGTRQLYFGSARPGLGGTDIYLSEQMADGSFGPAVMVAELSSPVNETRLSIRHDGLEIFFQSNRTGSIGTATDLWVATRGRTLDAWSTPVNLGDTINTASVEQNPYLSSDGITLVFASDRSGGSGGLDLYISTRALPTPVWTITGNLNRGRDSQSATLLPNGKVMVAGGNDSNGTLRSAELYDPSTGTWSNTGSLNTSRAFHTATMLSNGKVLVAGGFTCAPPPQTCSDINGAELYDPASGTWSNTGSLITARSSHTATLLRNGGVLVAGGQGGLNSAELYDPATGLWSMTGNLHISPINHTATLLPSGKLLVAGGIDCFGFCEAGTNSAELYDPATGTWSNTGRLISSRAFHTATLLPSGKVLVAGGKPDEGNDTLKTAETYDPNTANWSVTGSLNADRAYHTATLLPGPDGKVLVAGGFNITNNLPNIINAAELYDPTTGTWSNTATLNTARRFHTATLLLNGKVLAVGGSGPDASNSAELYDTGINPIDVPQFFVHQHYLDFLNREPDASGFSFWTDQITSCGIDTACIDVKRINVSAAFFLSIEFQETGYLVYRFYKSAYGNIAGMPVPVRLNESLPDTQQIGNGVVVGVGNWEAQLESNKQTFAAAFVSRSRFANAFPISLTPTQFVDMLFANASVTPTSSDRTNGINEFGSATTTTDTAARARVLRRVAENSTLAQQEFNKAFVLMQYFGYLRRNPNDAPEPTRDFQGYNFWLNKLNQFNGNFINAEMVKAFAISTEYRQRFGQP